MTVIRSASGTRIDCDECDDYAAAPSLSIEILRSATGYVKHRDRDYCPSCWNRNPARRFDAPQDDGPAAA